MPECFKDSYRAALERVVNDDESAIKHSIMDFREEIRALLDGPLNVPGAIRLAVLFHETYERLAPQYGYETKPETRIFDASSPNGKLMIAVCRELRDQLFAQKGRGVKFSRAWAMPTADTFDCKPMGDFVRRYLQGVSVDPFARNKRWATHTNDLNPATAAEHHMDATDFLRMLADQGMQADVVLIDPPYSPRQVKECYDGIGIKMKQTDALRGLYHKKLKEQIVRVLKDTGIVLTFGWNSTGMGRKLGFEIVELLLVCHGSDHNDTICIAERKAAVQQLELAA